MLDFLMAYKRYDPAAKSLWEIALLYPGPKAIAIYKISHFFYIRHLYFIARFFCELGRWWTGIEIHPGARIGKRLVIDHGMGVVIGETAEIGDDCIIFHGVTLGGIRFEPIKRHPTIGNNVLIGAHSILLGPISVGNNCKIGAQSMVTKNVPDNHKVTGVNNIISIKDKGSK
jgi:serine O-acetyltransferase